MAATGMAPVAGIAMSMKPRAWCLAGLLWLVPVLHAAPPVPPGAGGAVVLLDIKGGIGPATRDFVVHGLERARDRNARAVVLRIDTPGGLDAATRDINQAILASDVPVIAWVAPEGARAASAGTYILYACHIAAMAPATAMGAATPVAMGAPGSSPIPPASSPSEGEGRAKKDDDAPDSQPKDKASE